MEDVEVVDTQAQRQLFTMTKEKTMEELRRRGDSYKALYNELRKKEEGYIKESEGRENVIKTQNEKIRELQGNVLILEVRNNIADSDVFLIEDQLNCLKSSFDKLSQRALAMKGAVKDKDMILKSMRVAYEKQYNKMKKTKQDQDTRAVKADDFGDWFSEKFVQLEPEELQKIPQETEEGELEKKMELATELSSDLVKRYVKLERVKTSDFSVEISRVAGKLVVVEKKVSDGNSEGFSDVGMEDSGMILDYSNEEKREGTEEEMDEEGEGEEGGEMGMPGLDGSILSDLDSFIK